MKTYLGDGLYADYDTSAEHIILTTEDGVRVTNVIYMGSCVEKKLMEFIKKINSDERAVIGGVIDNGRWT